MCSSNNFFSLLKIFFLPANIRCCSSRSNIAMNQEKNSVLVFCVFFIYLFFVWKNRHKRTCSFFLMVRAFFAFHQSLLIFGQCFAVSNWHLVFIIKKSTASFHFSSNSSFKHRFCTFNQCMHRNFCWSMQFFRFVFLFWHDSCPIVSSWSAIHSLMFTHMKRARKV